MSFNLSLKKKTLGATKNIFDSQQIRWITGAITIDASTVVADGSGKKIVPAGSYIGKITANGKHGLYGSGETDGRQTAVCMIAEDVDCTAGDQVVTAFDMARVIIERLPVAPNATIKSQLPMITFVSKA